VRDCDDITLMIECQGSAGKKVDTQAQRGRTSKEARAMGKWDKAPYTVSHDPQEIGKSIFGCQRSRSQNRSLVRGFFGWGERMPQITREGEGSLPYVTAALVCHVISGSFLLPPTLSLLLPKVASTILPTCQ
jgi:hypothetical protein